jgi:hypothetical protein
LIIKSNILQITLFHIICQLYQVITLNKGNISLLNLMNQNRFSITYNMLVVDYRKSISFWIDIGSSRIRNVIITRCI